MGIPPTVAVLPATPCVHVLGGNRAQTVRVHEAALPWTSPCRGQHFTRRCTGIWGSAATKGPPSLAGAALGGPLVGPALGPSPARATLRAGGCLLCPVHISARKLDWAFEGFFYQQLLAICQNKVSHRVLSLICLVLHVSLNSQSS